jgi:cyclopropane-fatty-acyl-phospholipid synthase
MTATPSWLAAALVEAGLLPDAVVRAGIRRLIASRMAEARSGGQSGHRAGAPPATPDASAARPDRRAPSDDAPPGFYAGLLGAQRKHSCAWWDDTTPTLEAAEARMLALTAARAGLAGGQRVLDLGSGWGALSLWGARRFPDSEIVAVSGLAEHTAWTTAEAGRQQLPNVRAITADIETFTPTGAFDRVLCIEVLEHVGDRHALLAAMAEWLTADGVVFVQRLTRAPGLGPIAIDASDWMGRYFFSGDVMAAEEELDGLPGGLAMGPRWTISGMHYARTANAWLANMDRHADALLPALGAAWGRRAALHWWRRRRVFFMACAELWNWDGGNAWRIAQYALSSVPARARRRTGSSTRSSSAGLPGQ